MAQTPLSDNPVLGHLLKHEVDRNLSREYGTVKSGATRRLGVVLAAQDVDPTNAGITVAAGGSNTGNGTFTKDATAAAQAGVWPGDYTVTIYKAVANAGEFIVRRPDGTTVGLGTVGVTFSNEIKFAIADGATDFAVGDTWTVTVPAGDGLLVPAVRTPQTNGTQRIVGVLLADAMAASANVAAPYLARLGSVADARLVWDASFSTAAQKTAAWAKYMLPAGVKRLTAL